VRSARRLEEPRDLAGTGLRPDWRFENTVRPSTVTVSSPKPPQRIRAGTCSALWISSRRRTASRRRSIQTRQRLISTCIAQRFKHSSPMKARMLDDLLPALYTARHDQKAAGRYL
jgi:hypothetical protein